MHFVGLNRQNLNTVLGHNREPSKGLGIEGSVVIKEIGDDFCGLEVGDRVMVCAQGLLSTSISTSAKRCVKIPHGLSLEAAASMSYAFMTAFHGLVKMGRLQKGESVLIQPAVDSVGLALIQICQMIGTKIFVTADSNEQAQHLVGIFSIPRENIFHPHETSFHEDVMRETNDRGFDLVLSSELLHKTWQCVAEYGRLVDIVGEVSGHNHFLLGANRSLVRIDTTQFSPKRIHELLVEIITLLSESKIKPIHPSKVFDHSSIPDAFVEMREGHGIGKCIVRIPRDLRHIPTAPVAANMRLRSDVSYLLVGGLGALGKAFSTWMVESGARQLVFLSRSTGRTEEHQAFIEELYSQGCKVEVFMGDVTKLGDVRRVIEGASKPIAGIIQLAMVLNDSLVSDMTHSQWEETLAPKIQGTWNLHHATTNLPLYFFILLSSISAVIGTRGQGNYAAANTFLGAFAQYRQQQGLPAYVIDVGTTSRIGLIGTNDMVEKHFNHRVTTLSLRRRPLSDPSNRIPWKGDVRMKVARNLEANSATFVEQSKNRELETLLSSIESDITLLNATQTYEILTRIIRERVYTLMLQSPDEVDVLQSLEGLGVDSLVTIEIRNWWKRTLGLEASMLDILNASKIQGLVELAIAGFDVKFNSRRE